MKSREILEGVERAARQREAAIQALEQESEELYAVKKVLFAMVNPETAEGYGRMRAAFYEPGTRMLLTLEEKQRAADLMAEIIRHREQIIEEASELKKGGTGYRTFLPEAAGLSGDEESGEGRRGNPVAGRMTRGGRAASLGEMKFPPCPPATQDIQLNLKNRRLAIAQADYGPANPRERNDAYWQRVAEVWGVSVEEAKTMRCGNCAAFDVTQHMLDCIAQGIGAGEVDSADQALASELGYCRFFKFKCAASRTCTAWVVGGPLDDAKMRSGGG